MNHFTASRQTTRETITLSGNEREGGLTRSWALPYQGDDALDMSCLVLLAEELCGQTHGVGQHVCETVATLTQHRAFLSLEPTRLDRPLAHSHIYPVGFALHTYGWLYVVPHEQHPALPALPLFWVQRLSRATGAVLHLLEQGAFIHGLTCHLAESLPVSLTKREQDVLAQMGQGASPDLIGQTLRIATGTVKKHQERIREKFQVSNSFDAVLVAFQRGLIRYVTA